MCQTITETEQQTWLEGLKEFDVGNRLALMAVFAAFGEPISYLDVGCGTGAMVKLARQLGIKGHGVDLLPNESEWVRQHDLSYPFDWGWQFDLVTSIEVAEHIQPESAETFCDTLAQHVKLGGRLVLTAAIPGQVGYNHFNCQHPEYWREKLMARGLRYAQVETLKLVEMWTHTHMATHWLEKNLQIFRREV